MKNLMTLALIMTLSACSITPQQTDTTTPTYLFDPKKRFLFDTKTEFIIETLNFCRVEISTATCFVDTPLDCEDWVPRSGTFRTGFTGCLWLYYLYRMDSLRGTTRKPYNLLDDAELFDAPIVVKPSSSERNSGI